MRKSFLSLFVLLFSLSTKAQLISENGFQLTDQGAVLVDPTWKSQVVDSRTKIFYSTDKTTHLWQKAIWAPQQPKDLASSVVVEMTFTAKDGARNVNDIIDNHKHNETVADSSAKNKSAN